METALPVKIARWVLRNPVAAGGGGILAASLLVGLFLFVSHQSRSSHDRNPIIAKYGGAMLFLENISGDTVDCIRVGDQTAATGNERNLVKLVDSNNDGLNEIIWAQFKDDSDDRISRVFCTSVNEHRLIWEFPLNRHFNFPLHPGASRDSYGTRMIVAGDHNNDGAKEIYIVTYGDFFSSYIARLDARDGKEYGCYLHPGHILSCQLVDLDQNGMMELVIGGINNAHECAFLSVLDPDRLNGHGPTTAAYEVTGLEPAKEITYLRIPRTVVSLAYGNAIRWNSLDDVQVDESGRKIRVKINDAHFTSQPRTGSIYLGFSFSLEPFFIGLGDDYIQLTKEALSEGRISVAPDSTYFHQFPRTVESWNGTRWGEHVPAAVRLPS